MKTTQPRLATRLVGGVGELFFSSTGEGGGGGGGGRRDLRGRQYSGSSLRRQTHKLTARARAYTHVHICSFLRSLNECGGSSGATERDRGQREGVEEEVDESLEPRLVAAAAAASPGPACGLEG